MKRKRSFVAAEETETIPKVSTINLGLDVGQKKRASKLSHLLHVLINIGSSRSNNDTIVFCPSANTIITRLLQTPGTLEEIIASQNSEEIDECISRLASVSLAQLFSALMEEEVLCGSSMRSMRGRCSNIRCTEDASHDHGRGNDREIDNDLHFSVRRSTNVHSVLMFVERVLWKRYYRDSKPSIILSHVDAVDGWIKRGHSTQQLNNRFHMEHFYVPCGGHEHTNSHGDGDGDGDAAKDWVICVAFMMAYSAIYERLHSKNFTPCNSSVKSQTDKPSSPLSIDALVTAGNDTIIANALSILLMITYIADNMATLETCTSTGGRNTNASFGSTQQNTKMMGPYHNDNCIDEDSNHTISTAESILDKCFKKQLSKIDSLVLSIHRARLEKQSNLSVIQHILPEHSKCSKVPIDILLEEMQNDTSYTHDHGLSGDEDEVQLSMTQSHDALSQLIIEKDDMASDSADGMTQANISGPSMIPFETTAGQIRSILLQLTRSASTTEVKTISDSIADLIQKVGADFGADGITAIASILIKGQSDDDAHVGDLPPPFLLSDALVSNLCKSCVTGETSAVRASAFIYSFILPNVDELKRPKSRPPSRLILSVISALVRERHVECVESLFVPILCRVQPPSQAQCELVCRIIKSIAIPKDSISLFVSKILLNSTNDLKAPPLITMIWSDHSIPILTSCLQKKPILDDRTIISIAQHIEQYSKDANLAKSVKFSTLFHALVTKFGGQLKNSGSLNMLHESSGRLKTFLGKSILSSLKKL